MAKARKLPPMHPGEVLREEFMDPFGLTAYKLAQACLIPRTRIEDCARGNRHHDRHGC